MRVAFATLAVMAAALCLAPAAGAAPSRKKAMWGPTQVNGQSQFPIYRDLGVGIYEMIVRWDEVAPTRPSNPADPNEPAYHWPASADYAIREGQKYGIKVMLMLIGAPRWANGNRSRVWAPKHPADFAAFAGAASRRYPQVRRWMIWGEPTRRTSFRPLAVERHRGRRLTRSQSKGPRLYARILDASYGALKKVSRRNLVIGGNTFTVGDISPHNFIRSMRLPNGKPPRLDLYGHNPFTARRPNLRNPPSGSGFADFSDLDTLARWLDQNLRHKGVPIFISELTWPTHRNDAFNYHVTRKTQASWLSAALRITRRWRRIYTLGWFRLYDEPPRADNNQPEFGLLDWKGKRKPSYYAYRRG
jgi:hypothetical protein